MPCPQFEERLMRMADGELTAAEKSPVVEHLADCTDCRTFLDGLHALDTALARSLLRVHLSPDFERRLRDQLGHRVGVLADADRLARQRQLDAEFAATIRQMNAWSRWIPRTLDVLGYGAIATVAVWLVWKADPQLAAWLPAGLAKVQSLVLPTLLAAVFVAFGIGAAFRRRWTGLPG